MSNVTITAPMSSPATTQPTNLLQVMRMLEAIRAELAETKTLVARACPPDQRFTIPQAARAMSMSETKLHRLVKRNRIEFTGATGVGGVKITIPAMNRYLASIGRPAI